MTTSTLIPGSMKTPLVFLRILVVTMNRGIVVKVLKVSLSAQGRRLEIMEGSEGARKTPVSGTDLFAEYS